MFVNFTCKPHTLPPMRLPCPSWSVVPDLAQRSVCRARREHFPPHGKALSGHSSCTRGAGWWQSPAFLWPPLHWHLGVQVQKPSTTLLSCFSVPEARVGCPRAKLNNGGRALLLRQILGENPFPGHSSFYRPRAFLGSRLLPLSSKPATWHLPVFPSDPPASLSKASDIQAKTTPTAKSLNSCLPMSPSCHRG